MNGIWKYTFGQPEEKTPCSVLGIQADEDALNALPHVAESPLPAESISFCRTARGCTLTLPAEEGEAFFGTGLQLKSVHQTGRKKHLRVNSDPVSDTGDSHAPVPFYLSNKGYGVYVDTARYLSVYFASHDSNDSEGSESRQRETADSTEQLYGTFETGSRRRVLVDIPAAQGVDIYIFAGPAMLDALKRYNLFSGGGVLPPLWGLGMWYRGYSKANADDVLRQAGMIRESQLPCDVFGLEPGWQTCAYSCSYQWNTDNFPSPQNLIDTLGHDGFRVNLWEHIFVHRQSAIHDALAPLSGDYRVWDGLVPDYSMAEAVRLYAAHHKETLVDKGICGFKLDECDGSDFISTPWSFPELSTFPSGLDGEQMHCLLGSLYMKANMAPFEEKGLRTYGCVRSAGAMAAPYPYVLYSDLYDLHDYVRGMVSAGYAGLLWTPEVRQCGSERDLLRRLQAVIFSPLAQINAWMIPNPPWLQYDCDKNHRGEMLENREELTKSCRDLFRLRMALIPYLYTAFYQYRTTGKPPFRALPLDYPADSAVYDIEDSLLVGDDLLFAPLFPEQETRQVYLPGGGWYDFFTGEYYAGGQCYTFDVKEDNRMLLFVREGALVPLAEPIEHVTADTVFTLTLKKYGGSHVSCRLIEDDGETNAYQNGDFNVITVEWDGKEQPKVQKNGNYSGSRYTIRDCVTMG